jgi:tungstate transport system ATP-binding protein
MSALFELKAVGVNYGKVQALKACALNIRAGERVALVGSNGSGKSTLLRTLHGLVRPSVGTLQVDVAARQAMLFQHPYMIRASAQTNVALGLWLKGVAWKDARTQALQALERVGLLALAQRNAKALSGGQQQRLALARAWALRPEVLLLDEPTASLDPAAKREVEALMAEFAQAGMTLIFSSHNLGRVIYLERGRLLADLPTHDFFNGPLPHEAEIFVKGELV